MTSSVNMSRVYTGCENEQKQKTPLMTEFFYLIYIGKSCKNHKKLQLLVILQCHYRPANLAAAAANYSVAEDY